jgi:hypothetical protein
MFYFKLLSLFLIITFSFQAHTQENMASQTSQIIETTNQASREKKKPEIPTSKTPISASSIKKSIEDLFSGTKIQSLMFSETDSSNIDKAIEAFQNNQIFELEGEEETPEKSTIEEVKKMEQENVKAYIFLSSILYFGNDSWSLWVNDKKYTAKSNKVENELYFKSVERDKVNIIWKLSVSKWKILSGLRSESLAPKINNNNQVEIDFTLQPNQTFILSSSKVVNGKAFLGKK